ncbi:MAG: GNAT family N-acetyltransferase [Bryobacteraceae bacterium]
MRQLNASEGRRYVTDLAAVLLDCVEGGASVSFLASLSQAEAEFFFEGALDGVQRGERILLAAFLDSQLVGTVQVLTAMPPNQPHRADIAKLLVLRSARGKGIGRQLMEEAEAASIRAGKTLLVLDTATGDPAETLYTRLGWNRVGVIPGYAVYPNGSPCDTTVFWKELPGR